MTAMARPALLYFLLWLGVTLSTAMDLEKRIYGGKLCGNNERHYHVKLRIFHKNGEDTCGGSLVKKQWVLTAAHCWEPGETLKAVVNFHPGDKQQEMTIETKDIHKEENGHDIMLLKLPKEPDNPHSVNLPDDCTKDIKVGDKYQVAGYLHDKSKKLLSHDKLYCATLKAVQCDASVKKCYQKYPEGNWLCGEEKDVNTGPGDSGSGAVVGNVIYGVHQSGGDYTCGILPAALRVCAYIKWITDTMNTH